MQRLIGRLGDRHELIETFLEALELVLIHTDVHPDDVEIAYDRLGYDQLALYHQLTDLRRIARMMRSIGRLQRDVALVSRGVRVFQAMATPRPGD